MRRFSRLAVIAAVCAGTGYAMPDAGVMSAASAVQPGPGPGPKDGRTVDLRPKFRPGQEIRYVMNIDSSMDARSEALPELNQEQVMRQEITLLVRVVEAGTDGSTVELVYERVKVKLESESMNAEYDSGNPGRQAPGTGSPGSRPGQRPGTKPPPNRPGTQPGGKPGGGAPGSGGGSQPALPGGGITELDDNELLAAAMQGIAGTVVTVNLDASGNVRSVSGTQSLIPGGSLAGLGAVGGPGGGSWLITSPGQSGYARIGETWTTESSLGNTPLGSFNMVTRHTLRSGGPNAQIGLSGGIEASSQSARPGGGAGGAAQIKESRYTGTATWDTQAGQLREMVANMSATIDGVALGVPMTMRTVMDTKVKRVR